MKIQDPRQHAQIDVTGWDLDYLAELIATMRADVLVGSERDLTQDEADALTDTENPVGLLASPAARDLYLGNPTVRNALSRLGEIVDEALYQRDIPRALAKVSGEVPGELTMSERRAFGEYVDGIAFEPGERAKLGL